MVDVARAQAPLRKIGEMELSLLGLSAAPDPVNPAVPKNTPTALRIAVRAGAADLPLADVVRFLGSGFEIRGELAGPGLASTVALTQPSPGSSLLLPLPAITTAGTYTVSNLRIVSGGHTVLDVEPSRVELKVLEQVLITSVVTRPLTLQEIKDKGIVLEKDDVIGFDFTLALKLESTPIQVSFPVVFDRQGVPVPTGLLPPMLTDRVGVDVPSIVPMMLSVADNSETSPMPTLQLPDGKTVVVKIPALLVIPGNVGFLKQFFSAQLYVQNGAPGGTNLVVRNVTGTIVLPAGDDSVAHTADDPLSLPETKNGPQPLTQPVRGVGPDGEPGTADDTATFAPGQTGQLEFLLRGDREGFHSLAFDINATLDGLATGPLAIKGHAVGGVLVRNPFFDVTFTAPSVVRTGERFTLNMTLTNIGGGAANNLNVTLDASRMSGTHVAGANAQTIDTVLPGESKSVKFTFISDRTGQVVAHYLRFDPQGADASGQVNFTVGVGERGVPLSPDTLVLPAVVDNLPTEVVDAAMRVLGQGWSVANAPAGTLPPTVLRTTKAGVTHKALALAEAGLRVSLGQPLGDALRDFGVDFYGGSPLDNGFDQLLRTTEAGREFAFALGAALGPAASQAGGPLAWHRVLSDIAASGPDLVSFAVSSGAGAPNALALTDASGHRMVQAIDPEANADAPSDVRGAAFVPLGAPAFSPVAGLVTAPIASPYTLTFTGGGPGGFVDLSLALPRGDGTVVYGSITGALIDPATRARVVIDSSRADSLTLDQDADGDGVFETSVPFALETLTPAGPRAIAAAVIGPETLAAAQPFGFNVAVLFDRATDEASASRSANFVVPSNAVLGAHRQLSGRLVFASLARPEGPYVPTTMSISGMVDNRGVAGPAVTLPLVSKLLDAGAVIRGRVINADGTPVTTGAVTYLSNRDYLNCLEIGPDAFSAIPLGADGRFEFRYVRQDACGTPWYIEANDPATGALRQVSARVGGRGELVEADIVLFGRGSLTGIVRDLTNHPVAGATVVAVNANDFQSFGQAITDGDGRYTIRGLTVGTVNLRAYKGISGGRTTANVPRAGDTGTANITLDGGTVNVSGIIRKVDGANTAPLAGAIVVYYLRDNGYTAVGVTTSKADGHYSIPQLPVGSFMVEALLDSTTRASVDGIAAAGDNLVEDIAIIVHQTVTVHGHAVLPDASPATNTVVTVAQRGVLTAEDGSFAIPGVSVLPGNPQEVVARSRDGLRIGRTTVTINDDVHPLPDLLIALSGLGKVDFLVVDALGHPVPGQPVAITTPCASSCGCAKRIGVTGADGRVRFEDLEVGSITATAVRLVGGFGDEARLTTSISRDDESVFGVLRFPGFGVVTGIVLGPDGRPTEGADVALTSNSLAGTGCTLQFGPSHSVRTGLDGRFTFTHVNLGPVGVSTTHPFFDTTVGANSTLSSNGQTVDLTLTLVDTVAGQLSGTIFMPDHVTPAGAGVRVSLTGSLPEVIVPTDAQGHYQFAKIFPKGYYRITVRDPITGFGAYEDIYLNAGQDAVHDLRMKGQGTVRVHVVDGAGQPVTSAYITLQENGFPSRTFEKSLDPSTEGVAVFEHVFEGGISLTVTDSFGRGARPSLTMPGPDQTVDVTARLTTTGTVHGHFYGPDGVTPVPFGIVQLLEYYRFGVIGSVTAPGNGDDIGAFAFSHVPAGLVRVRGIDPLTGRSGIGVGTVTTEGELVELNVIAQGLGTVHGVVTSNGAPQPGAHVTIVSGQYSAATLTDADGAYLVTGVPEGPVVVTAALGNYFLIGTSAATMVGDGSDLRLDVALHDSGEIDGLLVEADGTTPGPIAVIVAQSGGYGGGTQSVTSSPSGAFHFERVPSGLASLTADVVGSIDQGVFNVSVPAAGTAQVTLVLNGVGAIDGTVTSSTGQPIAGSIMIVGTGAAKYSLTVTASIDGQFHLQEVLAGPFTARLSAVVNGLPLYGNATGVVTPNEHTALTIALQDTGTVTGLVLRPDGTTPAIGAAITIQLKTITGSLNVQSQSDGRFTVSGVPIGAFDVLVFDSGSAGVYRTQNRQLPHNGDTTDLGTIVVDNQPFSVVSIDPADGTPSEFPDGPFHIVLSAPVDTFSGIEIRDDAGHTYGFFPTLSSDGKTMTLQSMQNPQDVDLMLNVRPEMHDMFGRHLLQTVTSRFHTRDVRPPLVTSLTPLYQSIQVPVTTTIVATFTEPIAPVGLSTIITLTGPSGVVAGTAALAAPNRLVFTPSAPLQTDSRYFVVVAGAQDLTGNVQAVGAGANFGTVDTLPPAVSQLLPPDGWLMTSNRPQIGIATDPGISGGDPAASRLWIDGVLVASGQAAPSLFYNPPAPLSEGTHSVQATMADRAGNALTTSWSFTIDTQPPPPPTLSGIVDGQRLSGTVTIGASSVDATTGTVYIYLTMDGFPLVTLTAPSFSYDYNTHFAGEGAHTFRALAADAAGNVSAYGAPVNVIVDNVPLTMSLVSPAANSRSRDSVTVSLTTNEHVDHIDVTAGTTTVALTSTGTSYSGTLPLGTAAEGSVVVTATAYGLLGETLTRAVTIVVDRTPPATVDASRVDAEPPATGVSLVFATAGAVEASAVVRLTNTANGATAMTSANVDGSFSASIAASIDDLLSMVASDSVGNQSAPVLVAVRRTPALPNGTGNTSLQYLGLLADRVGVASGALTPDGAADAVFTLSLAIGDLVTRTLSYIDLTGPASIRTTRPGAGAALGVAADAGSPLLNNPNGSVTFPVTTGVSLTLFAADAGFVVPNGNYIATAVFTDGTRFVASVEIVAPEDRTAVAHSGRIAASPATIRVTSASNPGTSTLTMTDIRDIEGTRVPDGAKIAISAADMASKDPAGAFIRSAGGAIVDGTPAPNNPNFRVFTIVGGSVTAQYSSAPVMPASVLGALSVIQVLAADANGNVLGNEAISTFDLSLRAATDTATMVASPAAYFADSASRYSNLTISVPFADGVKVALTAAPFQAILNGFYVQSAGGTIVGGTASPTGTAWRVFTVSGGTVRADYSPGTLSVPNRQSKTVNVQVVAANADGSVASLTPLGTGTITLTGAAAAEVDFTRKSLPVLTVAQTSQVVVHHVHDVRANLLPDGVNLLLTANTSLLTTPDGCCIYPSAGGLIMDGQVPPDSRFRMFPITQGEVVATYSPSTVSTIPGDVKTVTVSLTVGNPSGAAIDMHALATGTIQLLGPAFGTPGSATPISLLADGGAHVATATFAPILDAYGNTVPDGTVVAASVATSTGLTQDGCCYYQSVGGVLLDGGASPSGAAYHTYVVQHGSVTVTYADQNLTATPGQQKTVTVMLMEATANGSVASTRVLGAAPLTLTGTTSATITASVAAIHADGADRRSTITVSNVRDSLGHLVPDGTMIGVTASATATVTPDGCCYNQSAGGVIVGGTVSSSDSRFRVFTIQNGQAVFEYSAQDVSVASGQSIARVQLVSVNQAGALLASNAIATAPIQLLSASSAQVTVTPADLVADNAAHLAQLTVSNLVDAGGTPIPDGAKVGLTAAGTTVINPATGNYVQSVGGVLQSAGTTAGDGTPATNNSAFQVYTVAGGQVLASYSDVNVSAGINQTKVARVSVVGASAAGAASSLLIATGTINLHGTTSTTASGATGAQRTGGTVSVTFSGIRDSAGNIVPNGTLVTVTAVNQGLMNLNTGNYYQSTGGTIVDGTTSPTNSNFKVFPVTNGSVTVTYSPAAAGVGTAQITIAPALSNGATNGSLALVGGVWPITIQ